MQKRSARHGFTLIELIFVIVIIGVLSAVAIPRFSNLTGNSKIASEQATASSVQSALDAIHSEWITNTCPFEWGNSQESNDTAVFDNTLGYPKELGSSDDPFKYLFKTKTADWTSYTCGANTCYKGPSTNGGTTTSKPNKPDGNDYWEYDAAKGTFELVEP